MRRLLSALSGYILLVLIVAPAALAFNDGRGFNGENTDRTVTNAGFILVGFFPLFVLCMSLLQWRLDKRKEARKAAAKRRMRDPQWRGGW
jgi:hypothetical protein